MAINLGAYYSNQGTEAQAAAAAKQEQAAQQASPSVGAGLPSMQAQNPAIKQLAPDAQSAALSTSMIGPNGEIMSALNRTKEGQLAYRPGEGGFVSGTQRVNLDPYAQQLSQAGNTMMQRGLNGTTLAGMPQVQADRMRAAQIDQSGFNQQAMQQNALARQGNAAIGQLAGAAQGQTPSLAAVQQQAGLDQAQRQAMSMAASARGGADQRAAAMRQGQMAGADIAMQGVNQAAALRAQEQATARGQLVGAIGQQQGLAQSQGAQAAQLAQGQAGLSQQAGLANQGSNLQASMANQQGYFTGTGMDQAMTGVGAGLYQQGAGLGMAGVGFNNQAYQTDFNQQMAMKDLELQRYGIDNGVAAQRYAADQANDAAFTGAIINAGGQLVGAGMQAFGPQQRY